MKRYAKTGELLRFSLRSNRVLTLLLVLLPFLFAFGVSASNQGVLQTPEQLAQYIAENRGNLLLGPIMADTMEGASIWRVRVSAGLILSILSIVLSVSTTRKEEDLGRLELLRAGAVGAQAPLAAALLTVLGVNLLGGLGMGLGFLAAGFPATGAFVAGFATALCAGCFGVLAALLAQLADNAQLARGLSFGVLALSMLVLALANALESPALLLCTPLGWCAAARPFAGERAQWFPLMAAVIALLIVCAFRLYARRDCNAGLLHAREGRASAARHFSSAAALAWRTQRGMLCAWLCAYALMGLVIGALKPNINRMLADTAFLPELAASVGGAGTAFLAILSYILAQVLSAYALLAVLRLREEEALSRAELLLSRPLSRARYLAGHVGMAFAGSAVAMALFGLCSGEFLACVARIPAVWLIASVAVFAYGIAPRSAAGLSWGVFGALLALELLWELRVIGLAVFRVSPFAWVYPGMALSVPTTLVLLVLCALFLCAGFVRFSRRDIVNDF